MHPERYEACSPKFDEKATTYLRALKRGTLEHLEHNVSVFTFESGAGMDCPSSIVAPDHLYIRGYYNALLGEIRRDRKRVLTGSPGTSTSYFQHYYLARLLCTEQFEDALPPDCYHSTESAQYVVRQFGEEYMAIYDLVHQVAERIKGLDYDLLNCFDPEKTVYMYEPMSSCTEPISCHNIPTLVTTYPDTRGNKQFCKNGASPVYMPTYTLEELLTIGRHMRENSKVPDGVSYADAAIKERFDRYTGIIRHCFPGSAAWEKQLLTSYKAALYSADARKLLLYNTLNDPGISDLLAQYSVARLCAD